MEKVKKWVRGEAEGENNEEDEGTVRWLVIGKHGRIRKARPKELPRAGIKGGVSVLNGDITIPKLDWRVRKRAKRK